MVGRAPRQSKDIFADLGHSGSGARLANSFFSSAEFIRMAPGLSTTFGAIVMNHP